MTVRLWFEDLGCATNGSQMREADMTLVGTLTVTDGDYKVVTNTVPSVEWHFPMEKMNCVQVGS